MALLGLKSLVVGPITALITKIKTFLTTTGRLFEAISTLLESAEHEFKAFQDFEIKPHWRSRVISVPIAIENIKELQRIPQTFAIAVKDLVTQLRNKFELARSPVADAEAAAEEAATLEGGLLRLFPRLLAAIGKIFTRLLGFVTFVIEALISIESAINDLQTILDDLRVVREKLDDLDVLFLPQKNPRRTISSEIGPLKIRTGNLHE